MIFYTQTKQLIIHSFLDHQMIYYIFCNIKNIKNFTLSYEKKSIYNEKYILDQITLNHRFSVYQIELEINNAQDKHTRESLQEINIYL